MINDLNREITVDVGVVDLGEAMQMLERMADNANVMSIKIHKDIDQIHSNPEGWLTRGNIVDVYDSIVIFLDQAKEMVDLAGHIKNSVLEYHSDLGNAELMQE